MVSHRVQAERGGGAAEGAGRAVAGGLVVGARAVGRAVAARRQRHAARARRTPRAALAVAARTLELVCAARGCVPVPVSCETITLL